MKHADLVAPQRGVAHARNLLRWVSSSLYRLDVRGIHQVPTQGPVILAANHVGFLDGPLLLAVAPRPTHVLAKSELFASRLRPLLSWAGQISVDYRQPDRRALHSAVATLQAGHAVGIFPEGHRSTGAMDYARSGVGYLAAKTGAPVVPVAIMGTRHSGKSADWVPRPGAHLAVVFGQALALGEVSLTSVAINEATERIRVAVAEHVRTSVARTGVPLPTDVIEHPEDFI